MTSAEAVRPTRGARWSRRAAARAVQWLAVVLSLAAALVALFVLRGSSVTMMTSSDGPTETVVSSPTLLEAQGASVLIPLLVPVLLTLVPVLIPSGTVWRIASIVSAALLGIFVVLGALSVGWLYVPALLAAIVAAVLAATTQRTQGVAPPVG